MGSIKLSYVGCSGRPGPTKVVELELASEWRQERRGLIIATPVTVAITSFGPRMPLAVGLTHLRPSQWSVREEGSRRSHDLAIPLRDQEIRFIEDTGVAQTLSCTSASTGSCTPPQNGTCRLPAEGSG